MLASAEVSTALGHLRDDPSPRRYPSEALAVAGAKVETGAKWKSQVVQDRELITGQQP
jgi:putative intracellular protease/amidase